MMTNVAVLIITNGRGDNIKRSLNYWSLQFELGVSLFVCGAKEILQNLTITDSAIIDFQDPSDTYPSFHINQKKYVAGLGIKARYLFFVHDRFYPNDDFKLRFEECLRVEQPDFGAVTVYNLDNSLALGELRVKQTVITIGSIEEALLISGRITVPATAAQKSEHIGLNGGQFFIKSELVELLNRPLRWVEMEDDILSFDLLPYKGIWINDTNLYTLSYRVAPGNSRPTIITKAKYKLYGYLCKCLALIFRVLYNERCVLSTMDKLSSEVIGKIINSNNFYLVDPMHKMTATEFLPATLEKITALCRLYSKGGYPKYLTKTYYGWCIG
ncbi:MAG: hypothetical protein KBD37_05135 [Burkholderiales bacterium]|nr:hypothetical protein [Burkholderiales bacterium]